MVNKHNKDVLVVGDGIIANLLTHILYKYGFNTHKIIPKKIIKHNRIFTITPKNFLWLKSIGLDEGIFRKANPIKKMKLFQSYSEECINFNAGDMNERYLAYMIKEKDLLDAISKLETNSKIISKNNLKLKNTTDYIEIEDKTPKFFNLYIPTEKQNIDDQKLFFNFKKKDFGQTAITFNCKFSKGAFDTASQFFFDDSILALLPFSKNELSVVWSCQNDLFDNLKNKSMKQFKEIFLERIKGLYSIDSNIMEKFYFPLSMSVSNILFEKRCLLIGDAAHKIHPMAGQGLNLGLRDLRTFETLLANRKSDDIGLPSFLRKYQRTRAKDIKEFSFLTERLNDLFLNKNIFLKKMISQGFAIINKSNLIKSFLINKATS